MPRSLVLFILLFCLSVGSLAAQGDAPQAPLIAYVNGELLRLEGEALVPYPACQPDETLMGQFFPAPDGSAFAMTTVPAIIDEALAELGSLGDTPFALNVWLCDTRTDTLRRIYAPPGADDPFTGEPPLLPLVTSPLAWSPDSRELAWTALELPEGTVTRLVRYDIADDSFSEEVLDVRSSFGFPIPPRPYWGLNAIFFTVSTLNEETFLEESYVYLYDPQGRELVSEVLFSTAGESDDFVLEQLPLRWDGVDYLALRYGVAGWVALNPRTGAETPLDDLPELYSPFAPEALSLTMSLDEAYNMNWTVPDVGRTLNAYSVSRIALAPDGSAIAYADSTLHLLDAEGTVREIANSDGFADDFQARVFWSANAWRVFGSQSEPLPGANVPVPLPQCDGAPPSQLRPGDRAQVASSSIPNNVRANPNLGAALVGQLPGGATFVVLDGPTCADGYAWYRVEYDELQGWTAEGTPENYFIVPVEE